MGEAKRRSNPFFGVHNPDCFAPLANTVVASALEFERDFQFGAIGFDLARGIQLQIELGDFGNAKVAQGFGVHAEGPITDPKDLGPAIKRAVEIVKRGEPALVDVVTQPR